MSIESSQMQQAADFGSEASFGQEAAPRELPHEAGDVQSYLRGLKEKQMALIKQVFDSHQQKLQASEVELSQSMREIQAAQARKKVEEEQCRLFEERQQKEEEEYKKKLSVKPQTVEEIRQHLQLQKELEQKKALSSSQLASMQKKMKSSQQTCKSTAKSAISATTTTGKKKGTLWYYQNREKAEFEFALREFLDQKEKKKTAKPIPPPKQFKPIIIKPEQRKIYNSVQEIDIDVMTPCSDDLSNYAFETGNDIMDNFKHVFENSSPPPRQQPQRGRKRRYRIKDFRDDELLFIEYFFSKIPNHVIEGDEGDEVDSVKKESFEQALLSNKELLLLYNIRPEDIPNEMVKMSTEKNGYVNFKEVAEFLLTDRPSISMEHLENAQRIKTQQLQKTNVPVSVLSTDQLSILRDMFLETDTFGDLKISLKQFMHKIRNDDRTKDWVEKPIAIVKKVDRTILMEDIFSEWEQWLAIGKESERRQKETIDWNTFQDMLVNYKRKDIPSRDKVFAAQRLLGKYDFGDSIEIAKEVLAAIKVTTELLPKYATYYVNSYDFIEEIRANKQYPQYKTKFVRAKQYQEMTIETVDDVLNRMEQECESYHTQDEILDFFSRKGRPKYLTRKLKQAKNRSLLQSKEVGSSDDSDSGENRKKQMELRKHRKVAKIVGSTIEDAKKVIEKNTFMVKKNFGAQFKSQDDDYIITVPKPYKFDEREKNKPISIRQQKLLDSLQEKQDEEDYYVSTATAFRANKIPKHVKNKKLWSQIMEKNLQRREQVKKESKAITLSRENPFTFYFRDLEKVKKRNTAEPQPFKFELFKAKHAPWYCRVRLFDRLKERQAKKSEQNIAKRIAELTRQSKLPGGVKNMLERLKSKDKIMEEKRNNRLAEYSFQPPRAKSVPNFKEQQKHFEDQLAEKKHAFVSTIPVPFQFQETRKAPSREFMDKENLQAKQAKENTKKPERERQLKRILTMKVKRQPPSTAKFEALVQKRRQEQEEKEYKLEVEESRRIDKQLRREKFAEFVNGCIQNVNHSDYRNQLNAHKQQEREARKMEKMQWEQQFDEKMTEMMRNVIRRPLLIEQVGNKNYESQNGGYGDQGMGENEDELYAPNFQEMTEDDLREYLNPETVDPQTLEARKYYYLQYIQQSNQMPNIKEAENEDEEGEHHENQQYIQEEHEQDEEHEEDLDHEEEEDGEEYQENDEEEGQQEEQDEEDFKNNKEFIEQQKQVNQIQQEQSQQKSQSSQKQDGSQQKSLQQPEGGHEDQYDHEGQQQQQYDDNNDEDDEDNQKLIIDGEPIPPHLVAEYKRQQREFEKQQQQAAKQQQQQQQHDGYEDDQEGQLDADGEPIPPHLVAEYKRQQREFEKQQANKQQQQHDGYEDDDDEEYVDEYGQPYPPHLVAEYKRQQRELEKQLADGQQQQHDGYEDEEDYEEEEDFDDYENENVEYVDEEGNPIPKELLIQYRKERQQHQAQLRQQHENQLQQQQQQQQQGQTKEQQQPTSSQQQASQQPAPQSIKPSSIPAAPVESEPVVVPSNNNTNAVPVGKSNAGLAAVPLDQESEQDKKGYSDEYEIDEDGNPVHYDDEEIDDDKYEYVDEEGNPIDPEMVRYLQQQQKLQQQQDEEDEDHIDSQQNKLSQESSSRVAEPKKPEISSDLPKSASSANNPSKVVPESSNSNQAASPSEDAGNHEHYEHGDEEGEGDSEIAYDEYNQRIPAEELKRYKEMAARGEIEMEQYHGEEEEDDGQEPEFENEEEQIEYYTQQHIQELKARGQTNIDEDNIRQQVAEQLLLEQQEQDQIEQELDHAIAQMSPEDLAQFVDDNGKPLNKEQIKYILMQQQAEYEDEDEGEGGPQDGPQGGYPRKKDQNSSF